LSYDLLVKNGRFVTLEGIVEGSMLVRGGKIAAIMSQSESTEGIDAKETIDANGCAVLPGMVDLHVHIGEPGKEQKEDTITGSSAAAAGGVTTMVVMPNCVPPVNSRERLEQRAELFKSKSFVDFALLGGAGGESLDTIVDQAEAGAVGYKSYLGTYREERKGLICDGTGDLYAVLEKVAESGRFIGFHAEDKDSSALLKDRMVAQGRVDFRAYAESRPEFTEVLATLPLLEIARATGARLYLVHMSSPRAIELAHLWRGDGTDVTVETCPHYLIFTEEDTAELGPYAQVAPPLRSEESREGMWDLIRDNIIDVIATDHAPGTHDEKVRGQKNIFEGGGGLPEFEVVWPLLLNEVAAGRMPLSKLVWLVAENPARIAQIAPQKGLLRPGSDADLVLVDLDKTHTVKADTMYTKNQDSARLFDGMELKGSVEVVIQRGSVISRQGKLAVDKPIGAQWVRP